MLSAAVPVVRSYLGELFGLLPLVAFLLVLAAIMWRVYLLGSLVKSRAPHALGVLDNLLGAAAGGLKWLLGLSLLLYGTTLTGVPLLAPHLTAGSVVLPWVQKATPLALALGQLRATFC
ncbi:MAG: CvpA family protein [Hymenobacter sp.]